MDLHRCLSALVIPSCCSSHEVVVEHCEYYSALADVVDQFHIPHGFDLVVETYRQPGPCAELPRLYHCSTKLDMVSEESMLADDEEVGDDSNRGETFPMVAMGCHNDLPHSHALVVAKACRERSSNAGCFHCSLVPDHRVHLDSWKTMKELILDLDESNLPLLPKTWILFYC